MTKYKILGYAPENNAWVELSTQEASGTKTALRAYIAAREEEGRGGGRFVAVAERSWQPLTVTAETKTQLRFS